MADKTAVWPYPAEDRETEPQILGIAGSELCCQAGYKRLGRTRPDPHKQVHYCLFLQIAANSLATAPASASMINLRPDGPD